MVRLTLWVRLRVALLLVWGGLVLSNCGDAKTDRTKEGSPPAASSSSQESFTVPPRAQGQVIAGRDLGMAVTGSGVEERTRSLDVLEHQLLSFLPRLHEIYEQERTADSGLMGSLDVQITIEPNGAVSDLRFPIKRVSSEKLTTAVYDHMRGWIFLPAESPVDFRYRLLFVPPGLETASISAWEKQLAGRVVVERDVGETAVLSPPAPAPVDAALPLPPVEQAPPAKQPGPSAEPREMASTREAAPRAREREDPRPLANEKIRPPKFEPKWYQVTRPSVLYTAPDATADIVTRLNSGKRLWVVRVVGADWLEVHSVKGRRPGFLPRETARPE
ncbi:MAG: hypothetical protein EXR78_07865 [Deltaproteobacteria bacterium]|nr:hypothetical protein [Deltaproteobacteria bacterium]